jgi:hypothetical protein
MQSVDNPLLGAVQVNVVDYKAFPDPTRATPEEVAQHEDAAKQLLLSLRKNTNFVGPKQEKVAASMRLLNTQIGDKLGLVLRLGAEGDEYLKEMKIPLPQSYRGKGINENASDAIRLHEALMHISRVDPGGNVPNMIRNIVHAMRAKVMPTNVEVRLFSTYEPVFNEWMEGVPEDVRERIHLKYLEVDSRKALHMKYPNDMTQSKGTLGLVTPMHSTLSEMGKHFPKLAECNHALVSESLTPLAKNNQDRATYTEFQNPSSAFRDQCAIETYNNRLNQGENPIISMNDEEMVKFIEALERREAVQGKRANSSGLPEEEEVLTFAKPFDENGQLHEQTTSEVTASFRRYFSVVHPKAAKNMRFPVSVSCGREGGYHVAIDPNGKKYAIFSSIPDETTEGPAKMIKLLGDPEKKINLAKEQTMGAGDSVATILSMAHIWDVQKYMESFRTKDQTMDERFITTASMIFISLISRYAGAMLFHSDKCDWSDIPEDKFPKILEETAKRAMKLAEGTWKNTAKPTMAFEPDWNIRVALWEMD